MRNRLKYGFLTITAPAWPHYSPRSPTYCPCPLALLPLPTQQRLLIGRVSGLVHIVVFVVAFLFVVVVIVLFLPKQVVVRMAMLDVVVDIILRRP